MVSARRASDAVAPLHTAEIPASIAGRRAEYRRLTGSTSAPPLEKICGVRLARIGGSMTSLSVASAPTTSAAVVRCTGPGRSAVATRSALRIMVATVSGCTAAVHLLIGENKRLFVEPATVTA